MPRRLPIFPLGTVLVPGAALPLHIFEDRYRALMADLTGGEIGTPLLEGELGVVGIARGHEVGGGEVRYEVGTLTRLVEARSFEDGRWLALFTGVGRFRVEQWLPDDPYPLAMVTDLPAPPWDTADEPALDTVRTRTEEVLSLAVEVGDLSGPVEVPWSDEPSRQAWEVCAAAPIGPFDRQRLLETDVVADRLVALTAALEGAAEMFAFRLGRR